MGTFKHFQLVESGNNEQKQSLELLRRCGLEIEVELSTMKIDKSERVAEQVGPELLPRNTAGGNLFNGSAHLGREPLHLVDPTPNVRLGNGLTGLFGEQPSKSSLALGKFHGFLNRFRVDTHKPEYDRDTCLMQQAQLLLGDSAAGRSYGMSMTTQQKERESTLVDLASRLKWAMGQAVMDDKSVASEVSRLVGKKVPWQTIQGVRLGSSKSSTYLSQIADVLKCSSVWLATGKGQPYASKLTMTPLGDMTPAAIAMARRWQSLPPNLQSNLYTVLMAFEALSSQTDQ